MKRDLMTLQLDLGHELINGHQVDSDLFALPRILLTKSAQVRMCGNSVCPPLSEALIRANFAHEREIAGVAA
jgi:DNA (cytosine-5)-methyltransferase 1